MWKVGVCWQQIWSKADLLTCHFTSENIDINDAILDGKNTFHATQMAAWQRGPASDFVLPDIVKTPKSTLAIPPILTTLLSVTVLPKPKPQFCEQVQAEFYLQTCRKNKSKLIAETSDLTFIMSRQNLDSKFGWTELNQSISRVGPEITTIGYANLTGSCS